MKNGDDRGATVPGACPPNLWLAIVLTFWAMLTHPKQVWKDIRG